MNRFKAGDQVKNLLDRSVIFLPIAVVALIIPFVAGCASSGHSVAKPDIKEGIATKKPIRRIKPLAAPAYTHSIAYEDLKRGKTKTVANKKPAVKKVVKKFDSAFQARLSPGWSSPAFRNLTIDGFRYSFNTIKGYLNGSQEDSIFFKSEDGSLLVSLSKHFDMELDFYPPGTKGHEKFVSFKLDIASQKGKIVHTESIENRLEVYSIAK